MFQIIFFALLKKGDLCKNFIDCFYYRFSCRGKFIAVNAMNAQPTRQTKFNARATLFIPKHFLIRAKLLLTLLLNLRLPIMMFTIH